MADLFQSPPPDDRLCDGLFYLLLPGDRLDVLSVGVYVMVAAAPFVVPAVFFKQLYQIASLHIFTSQSYYTHSIHTCQAPP